MRRTLNVSMNSLVPSEMEVILSLNIYVLSLYNIAGAVDTVVKKKCMTLTFFTVSRWWKRHITSPRNIINGNI